MFQMHPRVRLVSQASIDLRKFLLEWAEGSASVLTDTETLTVLMSILAGEVETILKHQIRFERHGNYDSPGGFSPDDED